MEKSKMMERTLTSAEKVFTRKAMLPRGKNVASFANRE